MFGKKKKTTEPAITIFDKENPQHWLDIALGRTITFADLQALIEHGPEGSVDIRVDKVRRISIDGWYEMVIIEADDSEFQIVVKVVGEDFDLRVYYAPTIFEATGRQGCIDNGQAWIYTPPEDEDNYSVEDLEFAQEIVQEGDVSYPRKYDDNVYGECFEKTEHETTDPVFIEVVEFSTSDADIENPELLLLETGQQGDGFIEYYQGCLIDTSDISHVV